MAQLVELQENYAAIQAHDAEVIVVFREDQDGVEGLRKSRDHASAEFPLLSDYGKETSGAYSDNGFQTYVIDTDGVIRAILHGTLRERPMADVIISELEQLEGE
jgi:peroxiredoxin